MVRTRATISGQLTETNASLSPVRGGASKQASAVVTSECIKSVYFSSFCEINKFSSLQTRRNGPQRQTRKSAAAHAAGGGTKLPLDP